MKRWMLFFVGVALSMTSAVLGQIYNLFQPGGDLAGAGSTWNSQIIANSAITTAKINNGAVDLTTKVTATLPVGNGGTGSTSITGLVLGNGASAMTAYAGTSCTNQFPRSVSAAGVATCSQVNSADLAAGLAVLSGTTGSIGGGALIAGQCASGTVTISSATTSMVALADPNTYPGDGTIWDAQVTAANTATVKVCAIIALTPTASTYNVRVLQ